MKRLLLLPGLLLLALSVGAQEGDEAPPEAEAQQETAPEEASAADDAPLAEPAGDVQPPQGGGAAAQVGGAAAQMGGGAAQPETAEAPAAEEPAVKPVETEEPLISVKVDGASGTEERDEDSIEVAQPRKRAVPTATVTRPGRKPKKAPAADKSVKSRAVKTAPVVAKGKTPVTTAPTAPAAAPLPAVPLTPITPRNP